MHCNIDCIGAIMAMPQPKTIEQMVDLASEYAQNNKGVRHLAVLLPFSALGSYNDAEAKYSGIRRPVPWEDSVRNLLTDLNIEYVGPWRLQFVLSDRTQLDRISDDVFSDAKQKVRPSYGHITMPTVALHFLLCYPAMKQLHSCVVVSQLQARSLSLQQLLVSNLFPK